MSEGEFKKRLQQEDIIYVDGIETTTLARARFVSREIVDGMLDEARKEFPNLLGAMNNPQTTLALVDLWYKKWFGGSEASQATQ